MERLFNCSIFVFSCTRAIINIAVIYSIGTSGIVFAFVIRNVPPGSFKLE